MNKVIPITGIILLAGCVTRPPAELFASGGSKSDGTIEISYDARFNTYPVVNKAEAITIAAERCAKWGYASAEPFEGRTSQCTTPTEIGCLGGRVTMTFQCLN